MATDTEQVTALHAAVKAGDTATAQRLLAEGVSPSAFSDRGRAALHCAASGGHAAAIALLLAAGVAVDALDAAYKTPLFLAAANGHTAAIEALVAAGASTTKTDRMTPLHVAALGGHVAAITALLAAGADVNAASPREANSTPLHIAAMAGESDAIAALLAGGAVIDARAAGGQTPLHTAAISDDTTSIALLAARTAVDCLNDRGETPLFVAAAYGCCAGITALAAAGAAVDHRDSRGVTPLRCAVSNKHDLAIRALVEAGVAVDGVDENGETALQQVLQLNWRSSTLAALLAAGASPNRPDRNGNMPLHVTTRGGRLVDTAALLAAGATVDAIDNAGKTALHHAAEHQHDGVVVALLAAGARIDILDHEQQTPLMVAAKCGCSSVARLLLRAGSPLPPADWISAMRKHAAIRQALQDATRDGQLRRAAAWQPPAAPAANRWDGVWDAQPHADFGYGGTAMPRDVNILKAGGLKSAEICDWLSCIVSRADVTRRHLAAQTALTALNVTTDHGGVPEWAIEWQRAATAANTNRLEALMLPPYSARSDEDGEARLLEAVAPTLRLLASGIGDADYPSRDALPLVVSTMTRLEEIRIRNCADSGPLQVPTAVWHNLRLRSLKLRFSHWRTLPRALCTSPSLAGSLVELELEKASTVRLRRELSLLTSLTRLSIASGHGGEDDLRGMGTASLAAAISPLTRLEDLELRLVPGLPPLPASFAQLLRLRRLVVRFDWRLLDGAKRRFIDDDKDSDGDGDDDDGGDGDDGGSANCGGKAEADNDGDGDSVDDDHNFADRAVSLFHFVPPELYSLWLDEVSFPYWFYQEVHGEPWWAQLQPQLMRRLQQQQRAPLSLLRLVVHWINTPRNRDRFGATETLALPDELCDLIRPL